MVRNFSSPTYCKLLLKDLNKHLMWKIDKVKIIFKNLRRLRGLNLVFNSFRHCPPPTDRLRDLLTDPSTVLDFHRRFKMIMPSPWALLSAVCIPSRSHWFFLRLIFLLNQAHCNTDILQGTLWIKILIVPTFFLWQNSLTFPVFFPFFPDLFKIF